MKKNTVKLIQTFLIAGLITAVTGICYAETPKEQVAQPAIDSAVLDSKNTVGLTYNKNKVLDATELVKEKRFNEAKKVLTPVLEWLEKATEHHANLYQTLRKLEKAKAQADVEKDLALKYAVLRDQAMYQMGLIYKNENKKTEAIECFVSIVRSQPRTELGFSAYEQLQEIGFTYKIQLKDQSQTQKEIE